MAKLLEVTTGVVALLAVLGIVSVVFNALTWVKLNENKDGPTPAPKMWNMGESEHSPVLTNSIVLEKEEPAAKLKKTPDMAVEQQIPRQSSVMKLRNVKNALYTPVEPVTSVLPPLRVNDSRYCPSYGEPDQKYAYKEAASYILSGLDQTVDPCEDFYAFTCNTYLKNHNATEIGVNRIGTYKDAQDDVNAEIVDALEAVNVPDAKWSETERLVKATLFTCVHHIRARNPIDNSRDVLIEMRELFGGIPFLNHTLKKDIDFFDITGKFEQNHAMGSLLGAMVSVDFEDVKKHSLFISQPYLPMARDFYVFGQHTKMVENRVNLINSVLKSFAEAVLDDPSPYLDLILRSAKDVVKLEMQIATASWPESELRNFAQQHNPRTLDQLKKAYPAIKWDSYFKALLSSVPNVDISRQNIIVTQPSYFGWLNALFSGGADENTIANYLLVHLIFEEADFLGGALKKMVQKSDYAPYALRRGKGVTRIGQQLVRSYDDSVEDANIQCLNSMITYMPFGPGYVYVKSRKNRDKVVQDIERQTELVFKNFVNMIGNLNWMTDASLERAMEKADKMVKNYGWPKDLFGDFRDSSKIDAYHKKDYGRIIDLYKQNITHNYYHIRRTMIKGYSNHESLRLPTEEPKRDHFLMSPAMVNAWYIPERNSITFPYAFWNPPYYSYEYPQAYNYAGQGGTAGHELVHGFDDQGVQFDADGRLSGCSWIECGWLEEKSKNGFGDMAQCVVTQYSTQCCPQTGGPPHCANGAMPQGENIADLGGQLAAYLAYREYITKELGEEEKRLPGLEQYTPNQIFWITYGFSWCMSQTDSSLIRQLLTDVHSPGSCRVNQVMQDIPEFARDFGCTMGQNMYPEPEQRCPVWVAE
uniref:Zinc metallopeptidase 7 n=1 Tax=Ancylostoma ceylanicum TaxID=53326 RepID=Q6UEA4_9BILA|nr:zinc metallopeptidase 7 [Ancylostoma ceylanicum]